MKKAIYESFGDPVEVLKIIEVPAQALQPGEVRVKVLRARINPSDVIQIAGRYGVKPPLPATAGNEGLGRVVGQSDADAKRQVSNWPRFIPASFHTLARRITAFFGVRLKKSKLFERMSV